MGNEDTDRAKESRRQPGVRRQQDVRNGRQRRIQQQDVRARQQPQRDQRRQRLTQQSRQRQDVRSGQQSQRQMQQRQRIRQQQRQARAFALPMSKATLAIGVAILLAVMVLIAFAIGRLGAGGGASDASADDAAQEAQEPKTYSVSFTTTGDLIFWREVADYIDANGGASAMAGIADTLADADVTISNLESPLSENDSAPVPEKDVYIIGRPQAIEGMRDSGIDIVSLANNHIMDYTGPALQDTLDALDREGILHAGAGMNEEQADAMVETTVNGASIAFFSWTDIVPDYYVAFDDNPGVASARLNMEDALRRVSEAKKTHDIVIVAMHWGVEYQDYIDDYQQRTPAHQLVDAGADVVLGNHPHVPEGIEFYDGSLIAYAHGNCVFRQSFDFGNTHESYVLHFNITQDGIQDATVIPLYLSDDYGIPSVAQGEQAKAQLEHLEKISDGMNTTFDIQGDVARITPTK